MHAVLITCHSSAQSARLADMFAQHAEALQAVPGLVMKTWLRDGEMLGGFHLFATRETAEEYLASALMVDLAAHPAFARCSVQHFAVFEELSYTTGTPRPVGV